MSSKSNGWKVIEAALTITSHYVKGDGCVGVWYQWPAADHVQARVTRSHMTGNWGWVVWIGGKVVKAGDAVDSPGAEGRCRAAAMRVIAPHQRKVAARFAEALARGAVWKFDGKNWAWKEPAKPEAKKRDGLDELRGLLSF